MSDTVHEGKISNVTRSEDGYSIEYEEGGCFLQDKHNPDGVEPKVGDQLTVRCVNWSLIRGMDLNGNKIYYQSDEELEAERIQSQKDYKEKQEREFEENKDKMDAQYEALPPVFKKRLDKFRTNNPNFRIEFESYELFCCEQALLIAEKCKDADGVKKFSEMKWEEQKEFIPDISDDHSGNTFGCAVQLAFQYLNEPENVVKMHGALAPLVGSKQYGCVPVEED